MIQSSSAQLASCQLLAGFLDLNAQNDPHGEAVVDGEIRLTHLEVKNAVIATAKALLASGVRKGDRVAVLAPPSSVYWISFLASAYIGAIWIGLNPRYRTTELAYLIQDSEPSILILNCAPESGIAQTILSDLLDVLPKKVIMVDQVPPHFQIPDKINCAHWNPFIESGLSICDEALAERRTSVSANDPCLIVYTSGSTGAPKGALLHQHGMVQFAVRQNKLWPVSGCSVLNYLPINHIGCIIDISIPAFVAQGSIIFMRQFDAATAMRLMVDEKISIWGSVPSVFMMQLDLQDFDSYDLSAVQLIVWGGAAMPTAVIERLLTVCSRLATNYGMTETSSAITALEAVDDIDLLANSVGHAFPGVEIKLTGESGAIVAAGEVGEILARSDSNFIGYWRQPAMTEIAFDRDGYFRTGDLAIQRPDGRYKIVGRCKEMFKSGGYNVYPREIENCIESHPDVRTCAVVSAPDPVWQEVGVAFILTSRPISDEAIQTYCRNSLANYKVPKRFVFVEEFPLLPIGKIDKMALQSRAEGYM
jgi:acyl-CoA synthetase (AMP-forming)/AMP-acid ligase II